MVDQEAAVRRLCESLVVDARKGRNLLGWTPPLSVDKELTAMANWFHNRRTAGN
jgi:nucleoside-diphosphate-sugar epimerase